MKLVSNSPTQTFEYATSLAKTCTGGEVILLFGDLGAGKTVFAKGVAAGLGVRDTVSSPTFSIMNLYKGERLTMCHCDAYRLAGYDSAGEVTEFFGDKDVVSVIEWPQQLGTVFDGIAIIKVQIEYLSEHSRQICVDKIFNYKNRD